MISQTRVFWHGIAREVFEAAGLKVNALKYLIRPGDGHVFSRVVQRG